MQLHCDLAVAIASLVFVVYACNLCLCCLAFVWMAHPFQMVVKCCPRQLSDGKQNFQFVFLPQFLNYLRFFLLALLVSQNQGLQIFLGNHFLPQPLYLCQ